MVRKVEEVDGSKEEVRKSESSENGEGVLLADLLTDALPDNQLLPSQLLAQLSTESPFSSQFPPPGNS